MILNEDLENLDDLTYSKLQDLVGPTTTKEAWICSSYPFRYRVFFPVQSDKRKFLIMCSMDNAALEKTFFHSIWINFVEVIEPFKLIQLSIQFSSSRNWA